MACVGPANGESPKECLRSKYLPFPCPVDLFFVINNSFLSIFTAKWWSKGSDIASDLSDRHVGQQA